MYVNSMWCELFLFELFKKTYKAFVVLVTK